MFCYFEIDKFDQCTIKCKSKELTDTYKSVIPPYNFNPKYWISIKFNEDMPDKEISQPILSITFRANLELLVKIYMTTSHIIKIPKSIQFQTETLYKFCKFVIFRKQLSKFLLWRDCKPDVFTSYNLYRHVQ